MAAIARKTAIHFGSILRAAPVLARSCDEVDSPLSTSETRVRPRRAGNTTSAKKAPVARKATAEKKDPTRLSAKSPARPMTPATPRITKPKPKPVAKKVVAQPAPKKRVKPDLEQDVFAKLHGVVIKAVEDLKARETTEIDVRGKTS
ncbi:MAG: hypothetical protein ABI866_01845, partial [Dokdonella sp.]